LTFTCRGACERRPRAIHGNRAGLPRTKPIYTEGDKYCPTCAAAWRGHAGRRCPCCMTIMRTRSRVSAEKRAEKTRLGKK